MVDHLVPATRLFFFWQWMLIWQPKSEFAWFTRKDWFVSAIYLRSLQLLCWNPQNSAYCVCWWIMPSIGWWPSDSSTAQYVPSYSRRKRRPTGASIYCYRFLSNDCMPRTRDCVLCCQPEFSCASVPWRNWTRLPLPPTVVGFVLNGSASSTRGHGHPCFPNNLVRSIYIVLNDSAQRLVTLYLAFTWFERYLNETKQAE